MNMSMSVAFLFLLSAVHPVRAADETVNMVQNGSFEFKYTTNTYGKFPLYWSRSSGGANSSDVSATTNKQGDYSLKLIDNSISSSVGVWTDPMPAIPGQVYIARAWGNRSSSAMNAKMYIRFFDAGGTNFYTSPSAAVGSVGSWSEGTKIVTAPANSTYARIQFYSDNASTGTVNIDCVSLVLADERVNDGDFGDASVGQLPAFWSVYSTHSGAIQDVQSDGGNLVLRLYDANSAQTCGAYYTVPASPGVPYKFTASVRKAAGGGTASIYLKFYNSGGAQIGTASSSTASTTYTNLSISMTAPAGTAYGRLLCYISSADTGTAYFDNISFTENYTLRYAAPAAVGSGAGTNAATAACYTNSVFWGNVDTAANSSPVKVMLLAGDYTKHCLLSGLSNSVNHILITGENPFAVNYCATDWVYDFIGLRNCANLILRHLHFSAAETPSALAAGLTNVESYAYQYVLRTGWTSESFASSNVRYEGLTFTGLLLMRYGGSGATFGCHDITWDNCSWARIGLDGGDHCLYNANQGATNLTVSDCYFQDCYGSYIKFRNRSEGCVTGCTFIATGEHPCIGHTGEVNLYPFQFSALNPLDESRDEIHGRNFRIVNNTIIFEKPTANPGYNFPYMMQTWGKVPTNHPNYHWVSWADGATIENVNESADVRRAEILEHFGVNMATDFIFSNNTYTGCMDSRFQFLVTPLNTNYWEVYGLDMDTLVGMDD